MSNFFYSLWPIFWVSSLFGIHPMIPKVRGNTVLRYSPKWFNCLTLTVLISYITLIIIAKIENEDHVSDGKFYQATLKNKGIVANFGLTIQLLTSALITIVVFIVSIFKRKRLVEIMELIKNIDDTLITMGEKMQYKKHVRYQIYRIFGSLFGILINGIGQGINVNRNNFPLSFKMWIIFLYPVFVGHLMLCQFTLFVMMLAIRAKIVNKQFEKLEISYSTNLLNEAKLDRINQLINIYEALLIAADKINKVYNVQMIPTLINTLFITAYPIFYFYWLGKEQLVSSIFWLCWGTLKELEIYDLSMACDWSTTELGKVGSSAHSNLIRNRNIHIEQKILAFSQQVSHNKFSFTVFELFKIDRALVLHLIGSSSMIVVMLIQYQEATSPIQC